MNTQFWMGGIEERGELEGRGYIVVKGHGSMVIKHYHAAKILHISK